MMQFERIRYKEKAKGIYKNNVTGALLAGLVIWLFTLSSDSNGVEIDLSNISNSVSTPISRWLPLAGGIAVIISIIIFIVFTPILTMAKNYLKELAQGKKNPDALVVWKKGLFLRVAAIVILQGLGIAIGLVLLVVPGIYLIYAWRYVGFIAIDEPDLSITEVFGKSMQLVNGNKFNLFIMDLSFFGWHLVVGLVTTISLGLLGWVANIILLPYIHLTDANAYLALRTGANEYWDEPETEIDEDVIDI